MWNRFHIGTGSGPDGRQSVRDRLLEFGPGRGDGAPGESSKTQMLQSRLVARRAAVASLGFVPGAVAVAVGQVKTTVPDVVPGARPAAVERITIHGKALEGNLGGDAADRDVFVLLLPSYSESV
jgi:hypothetical protein